MNDWLYDLLDRVANDPVSYAIRLIIVFVLLVVVIVSTGCAQKGPLTGICALKHVGEKGGIVYVQYHCEPD